MKKIAITKIENDQNEVGIQLRDSAPVTQKEGRIYIDRHTGELKGFINNKDVHLSFNVYEVDPTPTDKQVWINRTTNELKWFYNGAIKSTSLSEGVDLADIKSSSHYLSTLNEEELGNLADVSTTFPNYLIDAFNGNTEGAVLNNVEMKQSGIGVVEGETVGDYQLSKKVSAGYNYAEGSVVMKSKSFRPKTITDNTDGTHEIVFHGDLTPFIKEDQKMLAIEKEDSKELYLLNGELNPSVLEVSAVAYAMGTNETTITISDNDLDLTFGGIAVENINFKPLNMSFLAGSNGLSGNLNELDIVEANSLDTLSSILGDEQLRHMKVDMKDEKVTHTRFNHSENKQNWIIQVSVVSPSLGKLSGTIYMWKSTDGLETLEFVKGWKHESTDPSDTDQNLAITGYFGYGSELSFMNRQIQISDDGRYVFACPHYSVGNYHNDRGYFGSLNSNDVPRIFTHKHGNALRGQFGMDSTNHYYRSTFVVDWDENIMVVETNNQLYDSYAQTYKLDFVNNQTVNYGYFYLGADRHRTEFMQTMLLKEFEGEKQVFIITPDQDEYLYAYKFRYKRFIEDCDSGIHPNVRGSTVNISSFTSPYDGDYYFMNAFSNSIEGGNRNDKNTYAYTQSHGYRKVLDIGWDEESDSLVVLMADTNDNFIQLAITNFGRTRYGKTNHTRLEFDNVPDAGNFTLSVFDEDTGTTEITSPFAFSNSASQLQGIFEALSFVGAGNAYVSGDFTNGFDITFENATMRKELNITVETQSINQGGTPTVITVNELESGEKPIWLRHTDKTTDTIENSDANGWDIMVDDYLLPDYDHASGNEDTDISSIGIYFGQSLVVKNKTIMFMLNVAPVEDAHDVVSPVFFKIPDYTEHVGYGDWSIRHQEPITGNGSRVYYAGTEASLYLGHKDKHSIDLRGYRIAQKWNTGTDDNGVYSDGKIPVRTMQLRMNNHYTTATEGQYATFNRDDQFVRMRIMPVALDGTPDWDNPIALSSKKPCKHLANTNQEKWEQFIFDDVRLDQATDYFFGVELLGIDLESEGGQIMSNSSVELTGATTYFDETTYFYKDVNGNKEWVEVTNASVWFKWYDYYQDKIFIHHESGYNKALKTHTTEWFTGHEVVDGTLVEKDNGKMLATYRGKANYVGDYTNYSPFQGGSTPYMFTISDDNGKFKFPTVGDPKIMGGNTDWDEYLSFAVVPGHEDTIGRSQLGEKITLSSQEGDYDYNRSSNYGGVYLSFSGANANRFKEFHTENYGLEYDSRFRYGTCLHLNGSCDLYLGYSVYAMAPFQHDFIYEMEYEIAEQDLDSTHNILYSHLNAWQLEFINNHLSFYGVMGDGSSYRVMTNAEMQVGYQRLRVTRTYDDGIRLWRNFSKEGGVWEELPVNANIDTFGNRDGNIFGQGTFIGTSAQNVNHYIRIGRYTENTSYNCYGRIGYVKMAIGKAEFAYEGVNFNQKSMYRFLNKGSHILAIQEVYDGYIPRYLHTVSRSVLIKDTEEESSIVESKHTALKVKGSVEAGREISAKVELSKVSDLDPSGLEGYAVSFSKK